MTESKIRRMAARQGYRLVTVGSSSYTLVEVASNTIAYPGAQGAALEEIREHLSV